MAIVVLKKWVMDNEPPTWSVKMYISNGGGAAYIHTRGGFSTEGSLQAILDAIEPELWAEAVANGVLPTAKEKATAEGILAIKANGATKAIFTLTPTALETQVGTLVDALFPTIGAATKNQWKKVLYIMLMSIRVSVAGELEDLGV